MEQPPKGTADMNWEKEIAARFAKAAEDGSDELDVFLDLVELGFRLDFIDESCAGYGYIKSFMEEHGLL